MSVRQEITYSGCTPRHTTAARGVAKGVGQTGGILRGTRTALRRTARGLRVETRLNALKKSLTVNCWGLLAGVSALRFNWILHAA
jgi:hypothetical protein